MTTTSTSATDFANIPFPTGAAYVDAWDNLPSGQPTRRPDGRLRQDHDVNGRKYAWQILHAEIRRRAAPDEGLDFHPQLENMGVLMRNAREEGVSELDIIMELAGFGATFATMTQNDPLAVAAAIERDVMAEPNEDDDT